MKTTYTAALALVGCSLFGACDTALATPPPITLSSPIAPVPAAAGTGLLGQYYGTVANDSNIGGSSFAMTYISGHNPLATFNANQVNYPGNLLANYTSDTHTLGSFLGTDAASLSNPGVAANTLAGQLFDFRGYIAIKQAGIFSLGTGSDDGSRLMIGGQTIVDNSGNSHYTTLFQSVKFTEPGLYPIEIAYYETSGDTGVALYSNLAVSPVVPKSLLYSPTAVPEPGSVALLCGAGIGGSMLFGKRRRISARRCH